jgi:hypothetical protein
MPTLRWVDKTQPQTLMMATILMYINAAFGVIDFQFLAVPPLGLILVVGQAAAALGIANEKKWAYWFAVVLVALWLAFIVVHFSFVAIVSLLIYGALLALLLHPQSRGYRRIWFR